ncbi:CLUMA_CG012396, isoform A [Clunio marinus]|uniref:CLUMA_CG012396, isoform A n=1 Tax=Clunio marinus TaxID=568069 RepID=A0A1J1IIJ7_9DIPT|nr:CLUMA_CG012396, isoform A [Clunio marinus]
MKVTNSTSSRLKRVPFSLINRTAALASRRRSLTRLSFLIQHFLTYFRNYFILRHSQIPTEDELNGTMMKKGKKTQEKLLIINRKHGEFVRLIVINALMV